MAQTLGRHFDSAGAPLDGEFYDELYSPPPGTEFDRLSGQVIHVYELTPMEWAARKHIYVPTPGRPLPWIAVHLAVDSPIEPSTYVDTYDEYEMWSEGRLSYMAYGNGLMLGRQYVTVQRPTGSTFVKPVETLLGASEFFRGGNVLEAGWYMREDDSWRQCIRCSQYGN